MSLGCDLLVAWHGHRSDFSGEYLACLEEEDLGNGGGSSSRKYFVSVKFPGTLVPVDRSNVTSRSPGAREALCALPQERAAATEASGQEL